MGTEKVVIENNQVQITGVVVSNYEYSHKIYGEGFYQVMVEIPRLSDNVDTIPVMVSERLVNINDDNTGLLVTIKGQYRSFNKHEGNANRLVLYVFAREFEFLDLKHMDVNHVQLEGYICKEPIYRKTPMGREIADLLLAVKRPYGKSDYIPCICWGRNARFAGEMGVGQKLRVFGRIQSREYIKRIPTEGGCEEEQRVCYEVSASKVEKRMEDNTDEKKM